jgi:drug/metabolite transporter (DMT)-like permease
MPLSALALVIAAAFIHAYWNLLVKQAQGGPAFVWLFSFATAVLYAPVILVVVYLEPLDYGVVEWGLIASSGVLHLIYALTLNRGYRLADLSVVYPIARGTGPLISSLGAILLLGERPTPIGAAGIALIVVGILFTAGRRAGSRVRRADRVVHRGIYAERRLRRQGAARLTDHPRLFRQSREARVPHAISRGRSGRTP